MHSVDIALGLYNGETYLPELLESLEQQTFQDWRLVVRDDGSTDGSLALVRRWCEERGRALKVVEDGLGNLRVIGNFSACLAATDAPYAMPADQDDVWLPHKVQDAVAEMRRLEAESGSQTPIAVYCDLEVVDASLRRLHPSFLEMQGQGSRRVPTLAQLLTQNVAPGCSMIINRPLLKIGLPIPDGVAMHDWWLMLLARALGRVAHLRKPGIAYRQHGGNQVGARRGGLIDLLGQARHGRAAYRSRLRQTRMQAEALAQRLPADHPQRALVQTYASLDQLPRPLRQWRAWREGFDKVGLVRNIVFFILM